MPPGDGVRRAALSRGGPPRALPVPTNAAVAETLEHPASQM
jgi:hypothetical protein